MAEQVQSEETIFLAALERETPEEQAAYVEDACGAHSSLRQRVAELLRCHEEADGPLDAAPPGIAATINMPPVTERPGTIIGRYKLLEEIAEGGMGMVYMAEQREPFRRKVALKIIKPGMDTRAVIARFEVERQALAMMDHPNITKLFDAGETESGRSYFVMELVHGIHLTDYCDRNELTTRERLELFVQVCHAVNHAHQKGIIHRDLKPSNVLVTLYDGVPIPKIIDFGIVKATDGQLADRSVFTHYGQVIGTPLYMSPEQAEMSGLDVDTRSDIYSLGMMLYELLTGSKPFDEERVQEAGYDEIRRMIREDEPPRPSARISTLGAAATAVSAHRKTDPARLSGLLRRDLDWIVMKALEKDRTRRYQTASDFARDIQRYLADEPIEARRPTPRDRLAKWARRHCTIVSSGVFSAFGGAAAAILLGIVVLVSTGEGTVKLEFADADSARQCSVAIDGNEIRLENLGEPIKLRPGKHQLRIRHGDIEIEAREFDVLRRGTQVLHVSIPVRPDEIAGTAPTEPSFNATQARKYQESCARQSGLPLEITNSIGMKLVLIPSGVFDMGLPNELIEEELKAHREDKEYTDHIANAGPRHRVRITRPFYLGTYVVTQDDYQRVMGKNPSEFSESGKGKYKVVGKDTKRFPVEMVSWLNADEFCLRLSEMPEEKSHGRRYRLPSEAQWEYACRAGTTGRWSFSLKSHVHTTPEEKKAEENMLSDYGWFDGNSGEMTHAVGTRQANEWGLYDMYGNVWEWCADWHDAGYYARSRTDDPTGPIGGFGRVARGGCWKYPAGYCGAYRKWLSPDQWYHDLGFRVSLVVPEKPTAQVKMSRTADAAQPSAVATADKTSSVAVSPVDQSLVHLPAVGSLIGADGKWKLLPNAPPPAVAPFDAEQARKHQESCAGQSGLPMEITNSIGMKLVLIPSGEFLMGSPKELIEEELNREIGEHWYTDHLPEEGPKHRVRITRPFYLGVYDVTQGEYQRVMGTDPSEFSVAGKEKDKVAGQDTKRFPVEHVSWDDAVGFCRKLSELPGEKVVGRSYRLPSEAQWEYACRAGNAGRWFFSAQPNPLPAALELRLLGDYGWFADNSGGTMHAVGGKRPSAWGLYDMYGNVYVWCHDWYGPEYYSKSALDDPAGPPTGSYRVIRGGAWNRTSWECRSSYRGEWEPSHHSFHIGLRAALVPGEKQVEQKKAPTTESPAVNWQLSAPIAPTVPLGHSQSAIRAPQRGNFYAEQGSDFASIEDFDGAIAAYSEVILKEPIVAMYYLNPKPET